MNLLLDTHVLIWLLEDSPQISRTALQLIEDAQYKRFVSIATFWEIAIKTSLGKLYLGMSLSELETYLLSDGFQILPINTTHIQRFHSLPYHHRDPFDRMLAAQSLYEQMAFVSADIVFDHYFQESSGSRRLW